ncbi:cobyric acid synthase [bacterium]|nr:cobyric acid synthase [bacterium]
MPNILMFQGTGSGVGKSVMAAGFCRLLKNRGFSVRPFKSQNMSLNSGVTPDGLEMGRAQIVQAEACGVSPDVRMNPILLKPQGSGVSQLIRMGKVSRTCSAHEYYSLTEENFQVVRKAFDSLKSESDWIVMEGAGSPAEINLQSRDIVNMRMANYAGAKVILIGDIDKGGVFAWLKGTYDLIQPEYRSLIQGILINKFRGDVSLLEPGIEQFEEIVPVPVLGVIPWREMEIEDEDSQNLSSKIDHEAVLDVAVIRLPHISNFTDFDPLKQIEGLSVRFVKKANELGKAELIIIPGSKNTLADLGFLHEKGFTEELQKLCGKTWILGICGGFQMLGESVDDPHEMEAGGSGSGLGFLQMTTILEGDKQLEKREYQGQNWLAGLCWSGYEIHLGRSVTSSNELESIVKNDASLGVIDRTQKIIGTYIHGWLESPEVTRRLLALVSPEPFDIPFSFQEAKELEMEELADFLEEYCDVESILSN